MTTFQFTLRLDRELSEAEEDAIEAGVPEVHSIEGGLGSTDAHVAIDTDSFADAVTAVVWKIEATGQRVVGLELADLVTLDEIAARVGQDTELVRARATDVDAGFPATSGPAEWGLYPWPAVSAWFRERFPGQQFELDQQGAVADLVLRARSLADIDHRARWARLLTV
ncbi:hypothetical protein [Promicromonospora sp. NPDC060271]|uniref:hypothetical protein n=1 Tax=Promicromonospora sp. NPDC060271 TaxID=3347089 RepID=UPI00365740F8